VDTTEGLPFPDNSFDYVVQRNALYNYTKEEWDSIVIPEMIRVLKPGGWIEFGNIHFTPCVSLNKKT
jgi:ubiquinone/menaquinone biosynthesis C-methylase UbiE